MKGKKWLGMLTALSLCASMLAGCGSAAASEEKADTAAAGTTAESGAAESSTAAERTNFDEEVELLMYCIGDEGGIYADEVLDNLNAMLKEKSMQPSNRSWYPGVSIRKRCR